MNNENAIGSVATLIELPRLAASSAQGNPEHGRLRKSAQTGLTPLDKLQSILKWKFL